MEIDRRFVDHFEEIDRQQNKRNEPASEAEKYNMEEHNPEVAFIEPKDH